MNGLEERLDAVAKSGYPDKVGGWIMAKAAEVEGREIVPLAEFSPKDEASETAKEFAEMLAQLGATDIELRGLSLNKYEILCRWEGQLVKLVSPTNNGSTKQFEEPRLRPGVPCRRWPGLRPERLSS